MYKVIEYFTDLHDKDHEYEVGDSFPREGITVSAERLKELVGSDNKRGLPLIEEIEDKATSSPPDDGSDDDLPAGEAEEDQLSPAERAGDQPSDLTDAEAEKPTEPATEPEEKKTGGKGKGKASSK